MEGTYTDCAFAYNQTAINFLKPNSICPQKSSPLPAAPQNVHTPLTPDRVAIGDLVNLRRDSQ